jgi:molybdopterin adenylyltransferase
LLFCEEGVVEWREISTGVVVVSDRCFRGERADAGGPAVRKAVEEYGGTVARLEIVPDEVRAIAEALKRLCGRCDLILTTGGTGASPRDVTPEATREVVERELPGFGEAMRARSLAITPHAIISRGVAGIAGETLIINLPGSPRGAVECFGFVSAAVPHAVDLIKGKQVE